MPALQGVENIYTQHVPLVKDLVDQLIKNRLKEPAYPYLGGVDVKERLVCMFRCENEAEPLKDIVLPSNVFSSR